MAKTYHLYVHYITGRGSLYYITSDFIDGMVYSDSTKEHALLIRGEENKYNSIIIPKSLVIIALPFTLLLSQEINKDTTVSDTSVNNIGLFIYIFEDLLTTEKLRYQKGD